MDDDIVGGRYKKQKSMKRSMGIHEENTFMGRIHGMNESPTVGCTVRS